MLAPLCLRALEKSRQVGASKGFESRLSAFEGRAQKYGTSVDFRTPLKDADPEVYAILEKEKSRQLSGLPMIASENFTSHAVRQAASSYLIHKYSEGLPGERYYSGNEFIDQNERLCQRRALELFRLNPDEWAVNVQALSGSIANFAVYNGLLDPHDRIMGLELSHGGHLTHGHQTPARRVSASSKYFECTPYRTVAETGEIDYQTLEKTAALFHPKMIVAGSSSYPRLFEYDRIRQICDRHQAYLFADISHTAGLMAARLIPDPFQFAHVVTTTTHKTLRGPRGAIIFCRKNLERRINSSVFPSIQGGPHNHTIAAIGVALKEAATKDYQTYQIQVQKNALSIAQKLTSLGYSLVSGGTSTHLVVIDLRPQHIDGARVEAVAESVNIYTNKNFIPSDKPASPPSGLRIGTPAVTSLGAKEEHMFEIAKFIDQAVKISCEIHRECLSLNQPRLSDFRQLVHKNLSDGKSNLVSLKEQVSLFCTRQLRPRTLHIHPCQTHEALA
ncbi:uncharacterized protein LOC126327203 [Schistocerca gregaria]|uniref:uncharacterized protein LOC126327203 n=1 Tax=Schistocerca gregaria TaxID=7010 RepID=UPI00211E33E0|nr:uncharacterized protein LOC126327203 [Schistocerca gregaria]